MLDKNDPALWSLDAFNAQRHQLSHSGFGGLHRHSVLSSTLQAELHQLVRRRHSADPLEVIAACVRLREPALISLRCGDVVWPVIVFPQRDLYHSPRDLLLATSHQLASLQVLDVEAPGMEPPHHWMHERTAAEEAYRSLTPMLWMLAQQGPRVDLLDEIAGAAAYRVLRRLDSRELATPGAIGGAIERLRKESAPLRTVARWPGMSAERATRLINALYLTQNLLVSRANQRAGVGLLRSLFTRRGA